MNKQSIPVLATGWRFIAIAMLLLLATFAFQAFAQTEETNAVNTPEETIVSEDSSLDVFVSEEALLTPSSITLLQTEESSTTSPDVAESVEPVVEEVEDISQSASVVESTPELTTDKDDYHPGETATIFGKFFTPLQTFLIKVFGSDDGENYTETEEEVTTDDEGEFTFSYVLDNIYRPFYEVLVSNLEGEKVAETWFRDAAVDAYDQCSNNLGTGYTTGDTGCRWINGAIVGGNSVYQEGDSTVQRLSLDGFAPGSTHTVTIQYGTTKQGKHAYDFLTTWSHSENWITLADRCDGIAGCTTASETTLPIPSDPNGSGQFEGTVGARNFVMRGGTLNSATAPSLSGSYAGDSETSITISFTVPNSGPLCGTQGQVTSCGVVLWFGAHIAKTSDWVAFNGTTGATSISGAPYHVATIALDGGSIGNRDNQMQASAVPGQIIIVKDAVPNTAQDFSFTTTGSGLSSFSLDDDADGTLSNTRTFILSGSGTFTVTEALASGYALSGIVCNDPTTNSSINLGTRTATINLAQSETVTCTFTNTLQQGTLTLVKTVTNDNGGTAEVDDWTLSAAGPTPISGVTGSGAVTSASVDAGVYTLSESTGPTGYTAGTWSCPGATMNGDQVTVPAGQNVTCTINNNDNAPSLTLVKEVINDNGGTAVAGDWTLTASGYDAQSPDAGTYNLSESGGPAGYEQTSLTCSNSGNAQVTSVTLGLGENVTCTFVNDDQQAYVTVIKVVTNDNGGDAAPDDFDLTLEGNAVTSGVAVPVSPGTYTADETLLTGYSFTGYSGDCDSNGDIAVTLGESKTCTLTNNDNAPSLTLVKEVTNDDGGDAAATEWTLTADGPTDISGAGGAVSGAGFSAGTYALSESAGPDGYTAGAWNCVGGTQDGASVTLTVGEQATCTIINDDQSGTLKVTKITNPASDTTTEFSITASAGTEGSVQGDATQSIVGGETVEYIVDQGTYDVSEDDLAGWTEIANTCEDVVVPNGGEGSCTITNGKLPTLTLEKTVVNDHNGPATEASFTPSIDAVETTWDTPVTLAIGAHTASETTLDTYTAGLWGGACTEDGSVTLEYGDSKVCTITNDDKPGEIHGMKFNDENGNGTKDDGEVGLEDWTIFLDENGNDVLDGDEVSTETDVDGHYSFIDLARGTYTVREEGQSGWYQTTPNPSDIDLDNNEVVEDIDFGNYAIKALEVSKTAQTSFTRTHNWTIEKFVDDAEVNLFEGDSQTVNYDVTVTKTDYTDSDWLVEGEITITNPNVPAGLVASVTDVADVVGALGEATVTCPGGLEQEVLAGEELVCTYTLSPEEGTDVTNTATVTTDGLVPGAEGTASVVFDDPTTVIDDSINVTDTYEGDLGETNTSTTFKYERPLTCGTGESEYEGLGNEVPNTATITETGADDSQMVTVNCYGLTVRKTANTSFKKTWTWHIDKTSTTSVLNLAPGQTHPVYYEVSVTASPTDSDWAVAGTITIVNPAPMDAVLSDVSDMLPTNIEADVDCPELLVPANGSLECTYSASLPSAGNLINTAEVTTDNGTVYTGTTSVSFVGATMTEIDESIEVTDDRYGILGTVLASDILPKIFKYTQIVGPYEETACGTTQQFDNTAELTTNDSGTTADDTVTVDVNIRCTCSLTQGYWKTHNDTFHGGAPADENWFNLPGAPSLGENTLFFGTGATWYATFWTAPKGNVYYNLAHQYMAAKLNVLNGANGPTITADIAAAELLFNTYTPAQLQKLKGKTQVTVSKQFTDLAGRLAAFNEGTTNPAGHCTEIPQ